MRTTTSTFKTTDELVEEIAAKTPGGLTLAKKRILREYYEKGDRDAAFEERATNHTGRDDQ